MKEFLKVRNKKRFYLKTVEMEEDEFHEWRIDNLTFELSKYPIPTDKTKENNVIVHYLGRNKPWKPDYKGILKPFYDKYKID